MLDGEMVRDYFHRSAVSFDSLYTEGTMSPLMRSVNARFRRDIYERYRLTIEHAERSGAKSVLDIGCGSGRYEVGLAEAGVERAVGVDFSPGMIDLARQYTRDLSMHCEFICQDFMAYETDERFDLVFAMGVFDYVPEPLTMLEKMRDLATHSVMASFPSLNVYRTPIRKVRYMAKRCPVYFYTAGSVEELAQRAGFARHTLHKIPGAGMDYVLTAYKE